MAKRAHRGSNCCYTRKQQWGKRHKPPAQLRASIGLQRLQHLAIPLQRRGLLPVDLAGLAPDEWVDVAVQPLERQPVVSVDIGLAADALEQGVGERARIPGWLKP
jgi:hypothetical protein